MVSNLTQYLTDETPKGFQPRPYYSHEGDFVSIYFRDDEAYAERVDDLLTVYRSMNSKELVGCKVKGVRRLVERLQSFGLSIEEEGGPLKIGVLFLSAACGQKPEISKYYEEMGRFTKGLELDPCDLQLC